MFCLLRVLPRPPCSLTESYPDIVCLGWREGLVCVKRESNVCLLAALMIGDVVGLKYTPVKAKE